MKVLAFKSVIPVVLSTVFSTLLIQACSISGPQVSAQAATADPTVDPIIGLWASQVTITNCQTGATTRAFSALNLFASGGTLNDTDSQPPTGHGPGFGLWKNTASTQYTSTFQFFRFNADGTTAGTQEISRTITLSADSQSFTSTINVQVLDTTGAVIATACGTESATKAQS